MEAKSNLVNRELRARPAENLRSCCNTLETLVPYSVLPCFRPGARMKATVVRTMTDVMTSGQRSALMRGVRTKNTAPEIRLRRSLHAAGFRFRLHRCDLPGTPDIVLPRYRMCIFVHGCFWHGHEDCPKASLPKTRREFWAGKILRNRQRDSEARTALEESGWRVAVVWECRMKTHVGLAKVMEEIGLDTTN